ncbi:MAG: hypothetical protein COT85_07335 [Chlamydiae bacterium CG10_big_fil_rev_8_21_14_0_10_42_34]|nr:MAG: hypothetical protein COT85_07335 [Chlamydiae bacterium CG10_big_fil_rev_8_21_14_0_10_42_34]
MSNFTVGSPEFGLVSATFIPPNPHLHYGSPVYLIATHELCSAFPAGTSVQDRADAIERAIRSNQILHLGKNIRACAVRVLNGMGVFFNIFKGAVVTTETVCHILQSTQLQALDIWKSRKCSQSDNDCLAKRESQLSDLSEKTKELIEKEYENSQDNPNLHHLLKLTDETIAAFADENPSSADTVKTCMKNRVLHNVSSGALEVIRVVMKFFNTQGISADHRGIANHQKKLDTHFAQGKADRSMSAYTVDKRDL